MAMCVHILRHIIAKIKKFKMSKTEKITITNHYNKNYDRLY